MRESPKAWREEQCALLARVQCSSSLCCVSPLPHGCVDVGKSGSGQGILVQESDAVMDVAGAGAPACWSEFPGLPRMQEACFETACSSTAVVVLVQGDCVCI